MQPNSRDDDASSADPTVAAAWQELDGFVAGAQQRGLNPLLQIAVGGNAGKPPACNLPKANTVVAPNAFGAAGRRY